MFATVQLNDFVTFAKGAAVDDFKNLAEKWRATHPAEPVRAQIPPPPDEARLRLARLRTAGVRLRNRQSQLDEATEWISQVQDWAQAVVTGIERIDPADAEWFRTLDAVPPPRVSFIQLTPEYSKAFRELEFMLVKLECLLTKYSSAQTPSQNAAS